jgi:[ribosomal protein S5]-alanine N-acetyltransferase
MSNTPEEFLMVKTPRLILRQMTFADAEDIFAFAQDPDLSKYVTWSVHRSLRDTKDYLDTVLYNHATGESMNWGIVHKQDGKLIGTCGLYNFNLNHKRAEIGFALSKKYWHQGYMTEAVKATIAYGFHVLMFNRIEAICMSENIASVKVLQKCGMELEGNLRQYVLCKGSYWDVNIFSILKQDVSRFNPSELM